MARAAQGTGMGRGRRQLCRSTAMPGEAVPHRSVLHGAIGSICSPAAETASPLHPSWPGNCLAPSTAPNGAGDGMGPGALVWDGVCVRTGRQRCVRHGEMATARPHRQHPAQCFPGTSSTQSILWVQRGRGAQGVRLPTGSSSTGHNKHHHKAILCPSTRQHCNLSLCRDGTRRSAPTNCSKDSERCPRRHSLRAPLT